MNIKLENGCVEMGIKKKFKLQAIPGEPMPSSKCFNAMMAVIETANVLSEMDIYNELKSCSPKFCFTIGLLIGSVAFLNENFGVEDVKHHEEPGSRMY